MFQIKICGITRVADAVMVSQSGADAIGLNFFSGSRRHVSVEVAEEIVAALPDRTSRVGVFVNSTDDEICRIYDHLQLDHVQLHGDEPAAFVASLGERSVIRAFRLGPSGLGPIAQYLSQCTALASTPDAVLIDAYQPGQYGGTGTTADWELIYHQRKVLGELPLILAGGLRPDNVAAAIQTASPSAVDTAGGVESSPGEKDADLVHQFVSHARATWASR